MNRNRIIIVLLIVLAVIFRFYRLWDFQYWSVDEEIFAAVVRKAAVEFQPILLSPNVAVGISLGSFLHLLSAPIFIIAGLIPSRILIAGSVLGVITTLVVYKTGKELFTRKVGQIAALLYASSFLMAFSDRRWWPLSLDPLLATLSVLSVYKIAFKKDYKYSFLLALSMLFAWHADPSLAVIIVFAFLSLILFRIPLLKKEYIPAVLLLGFSFLPFFLFEFKHPGTISHPLLELFKRFTEGGSGKAPHFNLLPVLQSFARSLGVVPSGSIEKYFLYLKSYPAPIFTPLLEIVSLIFLLFPLTKIKLSSGVKVIYLYLLSFIIGILVFTVGMGAEFHQHYFVIIWPIFFLFAAFTLSFAHKAIAASFLIVFVLINALTLENSSMRYPLIVKEQMVDESLNKLGNKEFALYVNSKDRMFEGFGGIFFLKNRFPSNKDYYEAWDWVYQAYSLYGVPVSEGPFKNKVIISPR